MRITKKIVLSMLMFCIVSEKSDAFADSINVGAALIAAPIFVATWIGYNAHKNSKQNQDQVETFRRSLDKDEIAIFDAEYKSFNTWIYLYLSGISTGLSSAFVAQSAKKFEKQDNCIPEVSLASTVILSFVIMADHLEDVNTHRFERVKFMLENNRKARVVLKK